MRSQACAWLLGVVVLAGCERVSDVEPPSLVPSEQLPHLRVLAGLDEPLDASMNAVWCGAFPLAWKEACTTVVKGDIQLKGDPPSVEVLNRQVFDRSMITDDSYFAAAGTAGEGILEKVNADLRQKFGRTAPTVTAQFASPNNFLAYAYICKTLAFESPFERLEQPLRFGAENGTEAKVEGFGIYEYRPSESKKHRKMAEQVAVLFFRPVQSYDQAPEFGLRLDSAGWTDELVVAQVRPGATLLDTVKAVQNEPSLPANESRLMSMESVGIPLLGLRVTHTFKDLLGRQLINKGFEMLSVADAREDIRFVLNEQGAHLRAQGKFTAVEGAAPRTLRITRPFVVWLRKKDAALPYFVVWVATPDLMQKA